MRRGHRRSSEANPIPRILLYLHTSVVVTKKNNGVEECKTFCPPSINRYEARTLLYVFMYALFIYRAHICSER